MNSDKGVKINLGCGKVFIPGFINADISPGEGVDLLVDMNNLNMLSQYEWYGKVEFVYLSHVLEHFPTVQVPSLLNDLYSLLGEGGKIRIAVPDLNKICTLYVKNIDWFVPPHNPWLGLIYGGQIDQYDFHKTGYNFHYLEWLLHQAGFSHVVEVSGSDDLGILDGSQSNLPFGNISLNIEATKGSEMVSSKQFKYTPIEQLLSYFADIVMKVLSVLVRVRIVLIRNRIKKSLKKIKIERR